MVRDYVKNWYFDISDDPEFIENLHCMMADVVQTISTRQAPNYQFVYLRIL